MIFLNSVLTLMLLLLSSSALAFDQPEFDYRKLDMSPAAIERGRLAFMAHCNACHGLKYLRSKENPSGIPPGMEPKAAAAAFGVEPPDLSLIVPARGRGRDGIEYLYRLLTTYYTDESGQLKNRAFAEETQGEGIIAMPPPIPMDDPELSRKSMDISAFLYHIGDPQAHERKRLGLYVLMYMALLTAVLYVLNKATWKGIRKKLF